MKKISAVILALALCMGLAAPAFAATVNSDKAAYNVSNQPTGTWDFNYVTYDADDKEVPVTYTVQVVPTGTVVTSASGAPLYVSSYSEQDGVWYGEPSFEPSTSVTIEDYVPEDTGETIQCVFHISTISSIGDDYVGQFEILDDGIWLRAGGSASAAPETPAAPAAPAAPAEKPAQPATPAAAASSNTYTVKQGDTYGTIALNNYGTYGVWRSLYKANKYAKLVPGMALTLPEKLGNTARIPAPVAGVGEVLYTVKSGDTLGGIAQYFYGDRSRYKEIYQRNSDRLKNANTIYTGQVIVLSAR